MNNGMQINIKRVSNEEELWYAQKLYLDSFPDIERREVGEWIRYSKYRREFHNNLILQNGNPVGIITYWNFESFVYIEHFAVDPKSRSNGIGGKTLEKLLGSFQKPIVLEVEMPTDDFSTRRIEFYKRHGFRLSGKRYSQPPYTQGGNATEMKLMWHGIENMEDEYDTIVQCLYRNVYNVDNHQAE